MLLLWRFLLPTPSKDLVCAFHLLPHLCKYHYNTCTLHCRQSREWATTRWTKVQMLEGQSLLLTPHLRMASPSSLFLLVKLKSSSTNGQTLLSVWGSEKWRRLGTTFTMDNIVILTFQSRDVTSLLLGTSCPPSRIQCLSTNCVEPLVLFSLRFHILAVESPDLQSIQHILNPHDILKYSRIKVTYYILLLIRQIKTRLSENSISSIFLSLHYGGPRRFWRSKFT